MESPGHGGKPRAPRFLRNQVTREGSPRLFNPPDQRGPKGHHRLLSNSKALKSKEIRISFV